MVPDPSHANEVCGGFYLDETVLVKKSAKLVVANGADFKVNNGS